MKIFFLFFFFFFFVILLSSDGVLANDDPLITKHPTDTYVVAGNDAATLFCTAEGHPPPVITWYKDDVIIANAQQQQQSKDKILAGNNRVQLPDGSLFFLRVHKRSNLSPESDFGAYHCSATNPQTNRSTVSRTAYLKPAVLRDDFREHPASTEVYEGDEILLTCRPPKGDPEPNVRWNKNGIELQTDGLEDTVYEIISNGLRILRASVQDSGLYSCVAFNAAGKRESHPAIVVVKDKSSLSSLIRIPRDTTVMEGKDATFSCQGSENSEDPAVWRRMNGEIPMERSELLPDQSLKIKNVRLSDEGVYVCSVDSQSGRKELSASLTVHTIPSVSVVPREIVVSRGKKVVIACQATGNPHPNIFWSHESSNTFMSPSSTNGRMRVIGNGSLVIDSVDVEDAGEYVCQAVSLVGRTSARVRIDVKEMESYYPPIILYGPLNQTLPIGYSAKMLCQALGEPEPSVRWFKDNEPLTTRDRRIYVDMDGNLEITELKKSDSGIYGCRAVSPSGETWWSAHLNVELSKKSSILFSKSPDITTFPGPPSLPVASEVRQSSLKLSWKPPADRGASEVIGYVVEIYCQDCQQKSWVQMTVNSKTPNINIQNLSPDSTYLFVVRSRNSHGFSVPSSLSLPIKTRGYKGSGVLQKEDVHDVLTNQQLVQPLSVEAVSSTSIRVEWGFIEEYKKYVEGFIIKYQDMNRSGPVQSVRSEHASSISIENLEKFTWYEINVLPFFKHIEGMPTPARVRTFEDLPMEPPENVQAAWHGNDSLLITWEHPGPLGRNGILRGYKVYLTNNDTKVARTTQVDETVESLMMGNVARQYAYGVRVSAFNKVGESPLSREAFIGQYIPPSVFIPPAQSIVGESWFIIVMIVVTGMILWVVLCVLSVCMFKRHKRKKKFIEGVSKAVTVQTCSDNLMKSDKKPSCHGENQFHLLTGQRVNPCCYDNHSPNDLEVKKSLHARSESQGHTYQTLDANKCIYPNTWNPANNMVFPCSTGNNTANNSAYNQHFLPGEVCPPIQTSTPFLPPADIPDPAAYMIRYPPSSVGETSDGRGEVYVGGGSSAGSRSGQSQCGSACSEHGCKNMRHQNKFSPNVSSGGSSIKSAVNESSQPLLYCYVSPRDDRNSSQGSLNKCGQLIRQIGANGRPSNINSSGFYDDVTENCSMESQQKLYKHCNTPVSVTTDTDDESTTTPCIHSVDDFSTISSIKSDEYSHPPNNSYAIRQQDVQQPKNIEQKYKRPQIGTFIQEPRINYHPHSSPSSNVMSPADSSQNSPMTSYASTLKNTVI